MTWAWVGWAAQACFFSRVLVQWIASERGGRSVSPRAFWWLSLLGTCLLAAYATSRGEFVLVTGAVVSGMIYVRNLTLSEKRGGRRSYRLIVPLLFIALAGTLLVVFNSERLQFDQSETLAWFACVAIGQVLWSGRFLVQWWFTELRGWSHFPPAFWWMSLAGNVLLLIYALHLRDAVFVTGFLLGPIVQVRNLLLGNGPRRDWKEPRETEAVAP